MAHLAAYSMSKAGKAIRVIVYYRATGLQEFEAPRFLDNQHMKAVRLSALGTGLIYPQETFMILIFVRG